MTDGNGPLNSARSGVRLSGPSFSLRNRVERTLWMVVWQCLGAWTPPPLHRWRALLLRGFGAKIAPGAKIYGSAIVWHPANLTLGSGSVIGPRVRVYNQGAITIGANSVISQGAHLCASSHDYDDPDFRLILKPIVIGDHVWVAADAFVGPGVSINDGAVLGARAVAVRDVDAWTVQGGNPARLIRMRQTSPHVRP
ncbi:MULTISPECIES: acetyltransferase [Alphaproteobacteria]|uniref:acetyltransferase n=1 Tax=Alphaproteobacteria TaxID=28211 RepID=UPI00076C4D71|nr:MULTISPECIES: acetyltransferase [Alphaproteobacteria]KUR75528.1 acetyltransferase [Novosphingobium sp. Fuku2-ISO-50]MDR3437823.1 hypothetical protein [Telmatospirillum sp.]